MGMSLEKYAAQHPQDAPEHDRAEMEKTATAIKDQREEHEQAARLKESIMHQLEQGNAPEMVLYTAIRCIGLLSHDPDFTEAGTGYLDSVYDDLAQQSFIVDNAVIAAHRLEAMQREYNLKLRTNLKTQLRGLRKVADALQTALQASEALDPEPAQNETKMNK